MKQETKERLLALAQQVKLLQEARMALVGAIQGGHFDADADGHVLCDPTAVGVIRAINLITRDTLKSFDAFVDTVLENEP